MKYISHTLKTDISINKIYTVHYYEFAKDYKFSGESHNFWEFVYVDKGEVVCTADEDTTVLTQGNVIFHKPNEWHTIYSNGKTAANITVVSFECTSDCMAFFEKKVLKVGQEQKRLLSKIVSEFTNAFSTPLDEVKSNKVMVKKNQPIGSEQLIGQYLCEFLILFLRENHTTDQHTTLNINHSNSTLNMIINYMANNLSEALTIDDLVKYSGTNRMTINRIFKSNLNCPPIRYFLKMKIDMAKKYLRENNYNISQIAEILGYANIHYFSTQFKKLTGMSPIEYSSSIEALSAAALNKSYDKRL